MTNADVGYPILLIKQEGPMKQVTYEDAVLTARMLHMDINLVWHVIKGMVFRQFCELRIAVLNSPVR